MYGRNALRLYAEPATIRINPGRDNMPVDANVIAATFLRDNNDAGGVQKGRNDCFIRTPNVLDMKDFKYDLTVLRKFNS
jgi:hypothetical protein